MFILFDIKVRIGWRKTDFSVDVYEIRIMLSHLQSQSVIVVVTNVVFMQS